MIGIHSQMFSALARTSSGGVPYNIGVDPLTSTAVNATLERRWYGLALEVPTSGAVTEASIEVAFTGYLGYVGFAVYDSSKNLVGSKAIDPDDTTSRITFTGMNISVTGGNLYHFAVIGSIASGSGSIKLIYNYFDPDNGLYASLDASAEPTSTTWSPPSSISSLTFDNYIQIPMKITITT